MKRLFLLCVLALSFASCSVERDDSADFYYEILPIESVDLPDEFTLGETYEIHLKYLRPSTCYAFNDFYYTSELNQRTVAIINTVYPNAVCEPLDNQLEDVTFNFKVTNSGTYVFRFYQGEDENGNDTYFIVEVPVVE